MESIKTKKILDSLIESLGKKEEFGFEDLNLITRELFPTLKSALSTKELEDCFGSSLESRRIPNPKGKGKGIIKFKFNASNEVLMNKINEFCYKKKSQLRRDIAESVYDYLAFLPGVDSEYSEQHGTRYLPSLELITRYSKRIAGEEASISSTKLGRYRHKDIILPYSKKETFLENYRKGFERLFGESLAEEEIFDTEEDVKQETTTSEVNKKIAEVPIPDSFENVYHGYKLMLKDQFNLDLSVIIFNEMIEQNKTFISADKVREALSKYYANVSLNISDWCSKSQFFTYTSYNVSIKDEFISFVKKTTKPASLPTSTKKVMEEEKEVIKRDYFFLITQEELSDRALIKTIGSTNIYRINVDFTSAYSILCAYKLIINSKNDVIDENRVTSKIESLIKDSLKYYL